MSTKNEVYNEVNVAAMVAVYQASVEEGDDYGNRSIVVENLANEYEVTVPSMRAKLVGAGVYVAKESTEKTSVQDKESVIKAFEAVSGLQLPSFKNASRKDLNALWGYFVKASEQVNVETATVS